MNWKALAIIAVWVGLCFIPDFIPDLIPAIGPTLSSLWGIFWFAARVVANEKE